MSTCSIFVVLSGENLAREVSPCEEVPVRAPVLEDGEEEPAARASVTGLRPATAKITKGLSTTIDPRAVFRSSPCRRCSCSPTRWIQPQLPLGANGTGARDEEARHGVKRTSNPEEPKSAAKSSLGIGEMFALP